MPAIQITGSEDISPTSALQAEQNPQHPLLSANAGSAQRRNLYGSQQSGSLLSQLGFGKVEDLPPIESYPERNAKTHILVQGEACFIPANAKMAGLFTFGAGPCSILIVTARNRAKENPAMIGAGHIDSYVTDQALDNFFAQVANFRKVEVSVIGGCAETAEQILQAAKRAHAKPVFVAPNLDESRIDDAAIDKLGNIYYGVKDFSDPEKPEKMADVMRRLDAPRGPKLLVEDQLKIAIL
jgi:hypothetical protein